MGGALAVLYGTCAVQLLIDLSKRRVYIIGASLSEPHIDRTSGRFSIYYHDYGIYMVRPSSARRVRPHADQEVDRKSPTCLHLPASLSVSSQLLYSK